jgi:ABC-type xylose transport system permease subunit
MTQSLLVILAASICAIAGILLTARHGAATPGAGQMLELEGIAAAVLGGACLKGSRATIIGALLGALVLGVLDNGMSLMNLNISYQMVSKGLIILFVAFFDMNRYAQIRPGIKISN